jgi:hypothetical protein
MGQEEDGPYPITTCFRIVWTDPPTRSDFESHAARGDTARFPSAEAQRLATGVSVFRTLGQARRTAMKRPPWLGRGYIARLMIPYGVEARIERTTKSPGHYTLWADPASILSWVVDIVPVSGQEEE